MDAWFAEDIVNPETIPAMHYGQNYTEPEFYKYPLEPGRWQADVLAVPLPLPGLLLLGALGAFAALKGPAGALLVMGWLRRSPLH